MKAKNVMWFIAFCCFCCLMIMKIVQICTEIEKTRCEIDKSLTESYSQEAERLRMENELKRAEILKELKK